MTWLEIIFYFFCTMYKFLIHSAPIFLYNFIFPAETFAKWNFICHETNQLWHSPMFFFVLFISKRSMRCIVQVISFSCFSTFNKDKRKKNILLPPDPTVCFHLEILTVQVWSVLVWSVKIKREKKINQKLVHYSKFSNERESLNKRGLVEFFISYMKDN